MYHHDKALLIPVEVDVPNASHAALLLEQFGGANGELAAALQYFVQSFGVQDPAIKDLLLDISTEEIGHLEVVGTLVSQLLASARASAADATRAARMQAEAGALQGASSALQKACLVGGGGPMLTDSAGVPFMGSFVSATGDLPTDLASDIAAELRAKRVYEMLYRDIPDRGARQAIEFLLEREEAHAALFKEALERARDVGVMRDFHDKPFSRRYPDLQHPSSQNSGQFEASNGLPPIQGPLSADELQVGLTRLH